MHLIKKTSPILYIRDASNVYMVESIQEEALVKLCIMK